MYLNTYAQGSDPLDMTQTDEFRSLLTSAGELGIPHKPDIHYRSCNIVLRQLRFHFLEWGAPDAPPIVLLHGGHQSAHSWDLVSLHLAQNYRVLALDQRGHGDSGWGEDEHNYQFEDFYHDLCAVVQERGLKRFTLIGHSMGGRVSMLYASRHPETLERLVLVDITAGRPPAPPPKPDAKSDAEADLSRITETPPPGDFESHESAATYLKKIMKLAPPEIVDESVRHGMRQIENGRYTWKYDPALNRRSQSSSLDFWSIAKSIPTPTLLQYGSHSNVVTPELAARMAETMPSCAVERVEMAGHGLFTDQPEAFANSVERFMAKS